MKKPKCPKCKTELSLCSHGAWNCPNCFEFIRYASPREISVRDKAINEFKKLDKEKLSK